jgi:hypothetical protein
VAFVRRRVAHVAVKRPFFGANAWHARCMIASERAEQRHAGRIELTMEKRDIEEFDSFEKTLLDGSFNPDQIHRRMRTIVVVSLLVASVVTIFAIYRGTLVLLTVGFLAYIAVATIEKLSFMYTILRFESLVRKLVHRVESLEGVPLTPDQAEHVSVRGPAARIGPTAPEPPRI